MHDIIPGDNRKVHIRSSGRNHFEMALSLMFNGHAAKYWTVTSRWGLVFFWFMSASTLMKNEHHHFESAYETFEYAGIKNENGDDLYLRNADKCFWDEEYLIHSFGEPGKSVGEVLEFAWSWLQSIEYPPEPYHDGINRKGFEIKSQEGLWQGNLGSHTGVLGFVRPEWMWLGK